MRCEVAFLHNVSNLAELGYILPDTDTPAIHVPEALVLREGGKTWIYLFYACQSGGDVDYDYRYNRIRLMKRQADR